MPTSYTTLGFWQLTGVSFTGTEGAAGSTLSWTGRARSNSDLDIIDQDDDGRLDAGLDEFVHTGSAGTELFTGYTITSGGVQYGVFSNGSAYYVALPQDGLVSTIIPDSGTTNLWQSQTNGQVYLCFAPGTPIATPSGEVAVETLSIGDLVLTADGRTVAVKWLGRQTAMPRFGPAERLRLVRLQAGALGHGLPRTDLTVTADHALLIDGVLCHAGALVNGTSITRVPLAEMGERYTVYHVETEAHEIILAAGTPAETFIDNVTRRVFDNFAEFEALYGDVPEMAELPYPRAMSARQLPARIRRKLGTTMAA